MCGIAGVLGKSNAAKEVDQMLSKIKHRGPDGGGVYSLNNSAAIGMCRLRIRSRVEDAVPFVINEEIVASYNGEIYGTLTTAAEASLISPKGGADEVSTLLACDNNNLSIDGMYALAVANRDCIEIKRDPYGIKPLFYKQDQESLSFCSEISPLIKNDVSDDINIDAFDDLLIFGHTLYDQTIYRSINKLSVDTSIHYKQGRCEFVKRNNPYYQLQNQPDVQAIIANSVQKCMLSNRPVGLSVSAGLDSRILAHELNAQGFENLKTVSILVDDMDDGISDLRELGLTGKNVWQQWEHVSTQFTASDFPDYLERSVLCLGQPTRMTSFPLYMKLAELTHQADLTVLLSGEGADEIFYGYNDYQAWQPSAFADLETAILNFYLNDKHLSLLTTILGPQRVNNGIKRFKTFIAPYLMDNEPRKTLLKIEQKLRLGALLERTDLCLMQYSIEGRVPYLHAGLPEQMALMPDSAFEHTTLSKPLLRKAYASMLPTENIAKKRFRMPIAKWLSDECYDWAMDLVLSKDNGLHNIGIHPAQLERLMRSPSPEVTTLIFTFLSYIIWHRLFIKRQHHG